MTCNVGGLDRAIRFLAGLAILGAGLYFKSWWGLIGLVPLGTAIFKFCPAYTPLGISSVCKHDAPKQA